MDRLLIKMQFVSKRGKVARHCQRCRAATNERNLFAVRRTRFWEHPGDVIFEIRCHPLQAAYRDRLFFDPATTARRLTRAIASPAQDAGKNVAFPVDQVGIRISFLRDETNVGRHRRMRWARVLAVNDLVEILWITCVCRFQAHFPLLPPESVRPHTKETRQICSCKAHRARRKKLLPAKQPHLSFTPTKRQLHCRGAVCRSVADFLLSLQSLCPRACAVVDRFFSKAPAFAKRMPQEWMPRAALSGYCWKTPKSGKLEFPANRRSIGKVH